MVMGFKDCKRLKSLTRFPLSSVSEAGRRLRRTEDEFPASEVFSS